MEIIIKGLTKETIIVINEEDIDKFIDAIYWFLKDNYIQSNITIKKL